MLLLPSLVNDCHVAIDDCGGIHKDGGQCIVSKCCAIECSAYDAGQFICTIVEQNSAYKNEVHECSVRGSSTTTGYSPLHFEYGSIAVNSVNVSSNKCASYSAIWCRPNANGKLVTGTIKYSHIEGNEATTHTCLYMLAASGAPKHLITHKKHHFSFSFFSKMKHSISIYKQYVTKVISDMWYQ